jgi:hypothetical protein
MAALSISRAWEESKAQMIADGRLMSIVAAALIVLPGLIVEVVEPGATYTSSNLLGSVLIFASALLQLVGQLAIIRLAMTPAVSVGEAIGHGARRMPVYVVAAILLTIGLILLLIPFAVAMYAAGVPIEAGNEQAFANSPVAVLLSCLFLAVVFFFAIRMLMSSPVASEEAVGPVRILRRSWHLTAGHWWRLAGFFLAFLIGAVVAMLAVNIGVTAFAVPLFGRLDPMSLSALVVGLFDSALSAAMTVVLAVMLARIYVQLAGGEPGLASVPKSGT